MVANVLTAVGRCVTAGCLSRRAVRPHSGIAGLGRLFVEGLLGNPEGVHCCRHTAVEDHLRDDFRYFLFRNPYVQRAGDVPFDQLWTVPQHHQRGYGAEAAGAKVDGRAVVDLTVNHRVNQPHHIGGQLLHSGRRLRVVVRPVVAHPELGGRLLEINGLYFVVPLYIVSISVFLLILQIRPVWTQIGVLVVAIIGGHGVAPVLVPSRREGQSIRSIYSL